MKVVLIGFMGSGKTTVGRLLARALSVPHRELDDLVLQRSGHSSISSIFESSGESAFRLLEQQVCLECSDFSGIVSTGGGVIETVESVEALAQGESIFVFLKTRFDTICERLSAVKDRPLFQKRNKAKELYERREPIYPKYADIVIETDGLAPAELVEQIVRAMKARGLVGREPSSRREA